MVEIIMVKIIMVDTKRIAWPVWAIFFLALAGCNAPTPTIYQGYVEAEWIKIAVPTPGVLTHLAVSRGEWVAQGARLFELEKTRETAQQQEALARVKRAQAQLDNLRKGKRPLEIQILQAQRQQVEAALKLSELTYQREQRLNTQQLLAAHELDQAQLALQRDQARLQELNSQLALAQLPAREDEIAIAQADINTYQALLAQAEWALAQRTQTAPIAGQVFDTLYNPGEWVNAGSPVITLLPPHQLKIRFFVAEAELGRWQAGQRVTVTCDGCSTPEQAIVSYIAPSAEYTPPVLYNRENRTKLVYLIEARPASEKPHWRPGQPVTVQYLP